MSIRMKGTSRKNALHTFDFQTMQQLLEQVLVLAFFSMGNDYVDIVAGRFASSVSRQLLSLSFCPTREMLTLPLLYIHSQV